MKNIIFTLFLAAAAAQAQEVRIENLPHKLHADISFQTVTPAKDDLDSITDHNGKTYPAKIVLRHGRNVQVLTSGNLFGDCTPPPESRTLDAKTGRDIPIKIEDYNFDGRFDIAVQTSCGGNYGAATYDIYTQNRHGRFVKHNGLTEMVQSGIFWEVHPEKRTLVLADKSGCCQVVQSEYLWRNGQKPLLIRNTRYEFEDNRTTIHEEKLINGKWKRSTRIEH